VHRNNPSERFHACRSVHISLFLGPPTCVAHVGFDFCLLHVCECACVVLFSECWCIRPACVDVVLQFWPVERFSREPLVSGVAPSADLYIDPLLPPPPPQSPAVLLPFPSPSLSRCSYTSHLSFLGSRCIGFHFFHVPCICSFVSLFGVLIVFGLAVLVVAWVDASSFLLFRCRPESYLPNTSV